MKLFKLTNSQKGQSLIEAMVALGAAVLVVSAITIAVVSALNNVQYAKNQNLATQYAQQGLENMRQTGLSNWALLSSYSSGRYCLDQSKTVLSAINPATNSCGQNMGSFSREIDLEQGSLSNCNGNISVNVIVAWGDGKCTTSGNPLCHTVVLNSCLSNYNNTIQAP